MNKEEQIMTGFWDLFSKRMWIDGVKMKSSLKGYNPSEVHCIAHIGANEEANVTKLAEAFSMTRSAISKLTRKLMQKDLIESYQKPDNKKEVYFKLTGQGQAVYDIHESLHNEYHKRDQAVFEQVTEEQLHSILSFVELYSRHLDGEIEKMGLDIKAGDFDKLYMYQIS